MRSRAAAAAIEKKGREGGENKRRSGHPPVLCSLRSFAPELAETKWGPSAGPDWRKHHRQLPEKRRRFRERTRATKKKNKNPLAPPCNLFSSTLSSSTHFVPNFRAERDYGFAEPVRHSNRSESWAHASKEQREQREQSSCLKQRGRSTCMPCSICSPLSLFPLLHLSQGFGAPSPLCRKH